MNRNILAATNAQKVLNFLLDYPGREFTEKEIQEAVKISKSGTNYALRELRRAGFLFRNKKGRQNFYSLNYGNQIIKQLKIIKTLIQIRPLVESLKKISSKIILFGSSSRGENLVDSDIDLFIVSRSNKEIDRIVNSFRSKRKIQAISRSELKYMEMQQTDPVFYKQIEAGIVLWEADGES